MIVIGRYELDPRHGHPIFETRQVVVEANDREHQIILVMSLAKQYEKRYIVAAYSDKWLKFQELLIFSFMVLEDAFSSESGFEPTVFPPRDSFRAMANQSMHSHLSVLLR